jgi:hypothetical protein
VHSTAATVAGSAEQRGQTVEADSVVADMASKRQRLSESEGENGERREQGLGSASPKRRAWERWQACTSKDG